MDDRQTELPRDAALYLLIAALVVWAISLALPAFAVEGETSWGWEVLFAGILFGWMAGGWAAYANVFFFLAFWRIWKGKVAAPLLVVMLLLLTTLPMFEGFREWSSGATVPVVSWGWGAVLWVLACLLLMCAAHARAENAGKHHLVPVAVLAGFGLLVFARINFVQWQVRNTQERILHLPPGMAFTFARPCGVPLVLPTSAVIPQGERVAMDLKRGDFESRPYDRYIWLPELEHEIHGGKEWTSFGYQNPRQRIAILSGNSPSRYAFVARKTQTGVLMQIVDRNTDTALYEQPLKLIQDERGHRFYCPSSSNDSTQQFIEASGYDQGIIRALGISPDRPNHFVEKFSPQTTTQVCEVEIPSIDAEPGRNRWDSRDVRWTPPLPPDSAGLCSADYALLVWLRRGAGELRNDYSIIVHVFERKSLVPIRQLWTHVGCKHASDDCQTQPPDEVLRVRIESNQFVVETKHGEIVLNPAKIAAGST